MPMTKYLIAYAVTAVVLVALDMVWLRLIATDWYQQDIGHLMTAQPRLVAAAAFYLLFPLGLVMFAIAPQLATAGWMTVALHGAAFGFFAYATYDLTNLTIMKNWPLGLSLVDMAWGALVSGLSAGAGKAAMAWA